MIGDWEAIRDFLIGYCGRDDVSACRTSFIEYRALIKAHNDREYAAWDRVRTLAHNAYMLTATKGTKIKDRKKFMPLAWDEMYKREIKAIPQPASEAEISELNRIANLFLKKK